LGAQAASDAGLRGDLHQIVGRIEAACVLEDVVSLKKYAAARAAITDAVHAVHPVGYSVDETFFRAIPQDRMGLFLVNRLAHAMLDHVPSQTPEVEAHLCGMLAIRRLRIEVFPVPARTGGYAYVLLTVQESRGVFVRKYVPRISDGLVNGQGT
jgi:hypothetical protein